MVSIFKKMTIMVISCAVLFSSCQPDNEFEISELDGRLNLALKRASDGVGQDYFKLPQSNDYSAIPQDPKNPITDAKVRLGQMLFHESGIAIAAKNDNGTGSYSCASCHHAQGGFQACLPQGIGEGGEGFGHTGEERLLRADYNVEDIDVQPIRTPSALNVAYQTNLLWNGQFGATGKNVGTEAQWKEETPLANNHLGYEGTEIQAIAGLGVHRLELSEGIVHENPIYQQLFNEAFPNFPSARRISQETAGLAIAAYERTLLPTEAPFQRWLNGEKSAMTDDEKIGAILFFTKAKCASCHSGPALSSMEFHALGMKDLYEHASGKVHNVSADDDANRGRASFTKKSADLYRFKVPQLYNLKDSPFYGHGASFTHVKDVIAYKNKAVAENANVPSDKLDRNFKPLGLEEEEIDQIAAFLENGLRDPDLMRFVPDALPSGNCFPNNDHAARVDLGCE